MGQQLLMVGTASIYILKLVIAKHLHHQIFLVRVIYFKIQVLSLIVIQGGLFLVETSQRVIRTWLVVLIMGT